MTKANQIRSLLHSGLTTREIADQIQTSPAYVREIRNQKLITKQVRTPRELFQKYYPILPATFFAERFGYASAASVMTLASRYKIKKGTQNASQGTKPKAGRKDGNAQVQSGPAP